MTPRIDFYYQFDVELNPMKELRINNSESFAEALIKSESRIGVGFLGYSQILILFLTLQKPLESSYSNFTADGILREGIFRHFPFYISGSHLSYLYNLLFILTFLLTSGSHLRQLDSWSIFTTQG